MNATPQSAAHETDPREGGNLSESLRRPLTLQQKEQVGLMLGSLNAYRPDLTAIRESLQTLGNSMDPRAAYAEFEMARPKEWPNLPRFERLMDPQVPPEPISP